jgi:predicted signal transduction protein with EAL and GGDEF domain
MAVPIDDSETPECVSLTISIGVSSTEGETCELTDLLAAADAALYYAKQNGRNMTHAVSAAPMVDENGQIVDRRDAIAGLRQADPAGASLCPAMLLCVLIRVRAGAARAAARASALSYVFFSPDVTLVPSPTFRL